jgi:endonuclease G
MYSHLNYNNLVRKEANYFTNLTIQNSNYNKSIWIQEENFTSRVAKKFDEVYVIIGCIYDSIPDMTNYKIARPDKFFRVLLVKDKNQFQSIGLISLNDFDLLFCPSQKFFSISKIEEITNLQFFSDLEESIQKKLKSDSTYNFWIENFGLDLKQTSE